MSVANVDWERLDRFVRGDASRSELEASHRWVAADPTLTALAAAMRTVGAGLVPVGKRFDAAAAWDVVRGRVRSRPV
jgi:hypothetical protein